MLVVLLYIVLVFFMVCPRLVNVFYVSLRSRVKPKCVCMSCMVLVISRLSLVLYSTG